MKFLKWLGIVVGSLLLVGLVGYLILFFVSNSRLNHIYDVPASEIAVSSDSASVERGDHLATIFGCNSCHGTDLSGAPVFEVPMLGSIHATNLTTGVGGVGNEYTDAQMARAIRHGLDQSGKSLLLMPSPDFDELSDEDTAAIIAYIRSMPPVDHVQSANGLGPLGRVLFTFGQLPLQVADLIDHTSVGGAAPAQGVTVEYGGYLASACQGCHMADFAGGQLPGASPDAVPAANLTPAGELASWTSEEFIQTMHTGINPAARQLDAEMPYQAYAGMSDDELAAIFLFLQSLPPVEKGS